MKKIVFFSTLLLVIFCFIPTTDSSLPILNEEKVSILAENDSAELMSECDECLFFISSECLNSLNECFEIQSCDTWTRCVAGCEIEFEDPLCYDACDSEYAQNDDFNPDLKMCVCSFCDDDCPGLCGW